MVYTLIVHRNSKWMLEVLPHKYTFYMMFVNMQNLSSKLCSFCKPMQPILFCRITLRWYEISICFSGWYLDDMLIFNPYTMHVCTTHVCTILINADDTICIDNEYYNTICINLHDPYTPALDFISLGSNRT